MCCSERLLQIRLAAENSNPNLTFRPALNDRSLRMAEELRDAQDMQPAPSRPGSAGAWSSAARLPASPHPLRPTPGIALHTLNAIMVDMFLNISLKTFKLTKIYKENKVVKDSSE